MALEWSDASREHRGDLSVFVCTEPEKASHNPYTHKSEHPRMCEWLVQKYLRGLRVPVRPPEYVLVGYDGGDLTAVVNFYVYPKQQRCLVRAVASSQASRGAGYGREALTVMLARLRAEGYGEGLDVVGRIARDNGLSKAASTAVGMRYEGMDTDDYHEWWSLTL